MCGLIAYLWVETNNCNALIRIRSYLTPSVYLILAGGMTFLHSEQEGFFITLCTLGSYYLLFKTYQQPYAVFFIFHSFLCIGIGSLFFPPLLLFVPLYIGYAAVYLRSLSLRSFCAALIGLCLPYWFLGGYILYHQDWDLFHTHFHELTALFPIRELNVRNMSTVQGLSWASVTFLSFIGSIHYLRNSFNDKIRTRMLFYLLICQEAVIGLLCIVYPQHFTTLFSLLIMNSSPIISHYFALTSGKWTNILFIFSLLLFTLLTILNLWMPSLSF